MVPRVPKALFCWVPLLVLVLGTALQTQPLEPFGTAGTSGTVQAPERFVVRLETTKGPILIECVRAWAPQGADRFYALVTSGYYNDAAIFRIRPKTWAQFGIAGSPSVAQRWRTRTIPDDPFSQTNVRGTVAFAWAVPNGRTTQVFINLRDNPVLDTTGFASFGKVAEGMEVADKLAFLYGELAPRGSGPDAARIHREGNVYLDREFPRLDSIKKATILPAPAPREIPAVEGDGRVGLLVCDVSGKGLPGALVGSTARSYLRAELLAGRDVAQSFQLLNRQIVQDVRRGMYVTALYVLLDPRQGTATVACAGHKLPLVRYTAADKKLRLVQPEGIALGFDKGPVFDRSLEIQRVPLEPGDRLVLVNTGAVSLTNAAGQELGEKAFYKQVLAFAAEPADQFLERLKGALTKYAGQGALPRDVSIVSVRRSP